MDPIHKGKVDNYKLELFHKESLKRRVESLNGKFVDLILRESKKKRSRNQNNYMFGVVYEYIRQEMGELTQKDIHNYMRMMFWNTEINGVVIPKSTTKMSTKDMEEYLEKCRIWAIGFLNCRIPLPNEINY